VESLLSVQEKGPTFLSGGVLEDAAKVLVKGEALSLVGKALKQYQIISLLGSGGMGEVYLAEDTRLKRKVAVKVLPVVFTQDLQRVQRFEREARTASALNHPNIITIHEVGEAEGLRFIVTEFIEGETLRGRMKGAPLELPVVVDLATQIAGALGAAHAAGIVHRDLKPENIMVRPDGVVKILDFGLAKLVEPQVSSADTRASLSMAGHTAAGVILGTFCYMSPEQALGREADARSDIFSFGVVLYEMLSGQQPFQGATDLETLQKTLHESPRALGPEVPQALRVIVEKALEKDPSQRYQSMREVVTDLRSPVPQQPIAVLGGARLLKTPPDRRGKFVRWGIALGSCAVLLALFPVGNRFWRWAQQMPEHPPKALTANSEENPVKTAVISPDAAYLAYSDTTGAYLRQVSTGETHPLMLPKGFKAEPIAWYPDSNHLLVQLFAQADEKPSLWSVSILGGAARKLADDAWGASVSPDGSRVAFIRNAVGVSGICRLHLDCLYALGREIWTMAADGSDPKKIIDADVQDRFGPVAWSPHGRRIAYAKFQGGPNNSQFFIETRAVDAGKPEVLLSDSRLNVQQAMRLAWQPMVCWTPDGRLIFALQEPAPDQIDSNAWALQIDEETGRQVSKQIRLTSGPGAISSFSMTSDGTRLTFIKSTLQPEVYIGELTNSGSALKNNRRLTLDQRPNMPTAWTPDSKSVIVSSFVDGRRAILRQRISEPTAELLVSDRERDEMPARTGPDGHELFYLSFPQLPGSSPVRLMRIPIAGGPPRLILEALGISGLRCAQLPATTCVFAQYYQGTNTFTAFDSVLGTIREILKKQSNQSLVANWSISPDGSELVFVEQDQREAHLHFYSLRDGSTREVLVKGWSGLGSWDPAPDGRSFYTSAIQPDGTIALLNIDLQGNAHVLFKQKNGAVCWAIPSPDGKLLADMIMHGESNAWMLEKF